MNIIVLGAGTFGTAFANELSVNPQNTVLLFSSNQSKIDEINFLGIVVYVKFFCSRKFL